MNKTLIVVIVIVLIVVAILAYFLLQPKKVEPVEQNQQEQTNTNSFDIQGMKVEILKEGSGDPAKSGDTVTVNYVGTLQDGTKFDSSIDRNMPFELILGRNTVIQGWELGLLGMKVGEKRKLTIPPELAYGVNGYPPMIPGSATLTFEVDMLNIKVQGK